MWKLIIFLLVILDVCLYLCATVPTQPPTSQTTISEAMLAMGNTDMPPGKANQALFLYTHKYNNTNFHYQNNQDMSSWITPRPKGLMLQNNCISQYMKCLMSLSSPQPVCAYNEPHDHARGYFTASTSCDVYFENCRRGYRVWRILDTGRCQFQFHDSNDHIAKDKHKPKYTAG